MERSREILLKLAASKPGRPDEFVKNRPKCTYPTSFLSKLQITYRGKSTSVILKKTAESEQLPYGREHSPNLITLFETWMHNND
jgi:hypothetical protein